MTIDTSKEAVERLASRLAGTPLYEGSGEDSHLGEYGAETITALASERDAQSARADAAEAEVARLRKVYWQLRSYATHDDKCKLNKAPSFTGPCSCGLSEATKAGE